MNTGVPQGVSRSHQIGWLDTDHGIKTWPAHSDEPLRQYLQRIRALAKGNCRDLEYAAGVIQRCDQYLQGEA